MMCRPCCSRAVAILASSMTWNGAMLCKREARSWKLMGMCRKTEVAAPRSCPRAARKISGRNSTATGADFRFAHLGSKTIEHAVDVFVTVDAAKGLGQLNRFVDDDLVRDLRIVLQLERANQQRRMLDRRQLGNGTINQWRQPGAQVSDLLD